MIDLIDNTSSLKIQKEKKIFERDDDFFMSHCDDVDDVVMLVDICPETPIHCSR